MTIVSYTPTALVQTTFKINAGRDGKVNLTRIGILYLLAAALQSGWLVVVVSNFETAKHMMHLPMIGWPCAAIWAFMAWFVLHLSYIGVRVILLNRDKRNLVVQTELQKRKQTTVATLLLLGITIDVTCFLLGFNLEIKDIGLVLYISAFMGGRVVQANAEAVFLYHGV